MIILSILSDIKNIFLLRDSKDTGIENSENIYKEFLYLDINTCKDVFGKNIISGWTEKNIENINNITNDTQTIKTDEKRILVDYCFMTFLCGNDFVRAVPFLKIKEGGIDVLIRIYKNLHNELQEYLIDSDYTINYVFLHCLIQDLADVEDSHMKKWQRKRDRIRRGVKPKKEFEEDMSKNEPWNLEIIRFNHEEYYSPKHPLYDVFNKVFDKIDYYKEDWIKSYNKHFFESEDVNIVCYEYIKSLNFCLQYYFKGIPSWSWYYKYRNSPTMKDLSKYLGKCIDNVEDGYNGNIIDIKWNIGKPYLQFEQLMLILPKHSFKLLPKCLILTE